MIPDNIHKSVKHTYNSLLAFQIASTPPVNFKLIKQGINNLTILMQFATFIYVV